MVQLLLVGAVLVLLALPVWVILRLVALGQQNEKLARRLADLEAELKTLRDARRPAGANLPAAREATPMPAAVPPRSVEPAVPPPPSVATAAPLPPAVLPPLPSPSSRASGAAMPPASPPLESRDSAPQRRGRVDWEQFMGAKLFAWLGGLAAFLGAAFFIKYSFEHELIPPAMRIAIGYVFALGLVIGGLKTPRDRYAITAQTLIATGVVSLYAVTFASNSIYHLAFFGPLSTFVVMSLITAAAFLLAVRLDARVVAVLGILGGFLTPVLLSTGQDKPVELFSYVALLDAGLIAVALQRRWHFLVPLGALGTVGLQVDWSLPKLTPNGAPGVIAVALVFCGLFLAAHLAARYLTRPAPSGAHEAASGAPPTPPEIAWSAVALPVVAFGLALALLMVPEVAARPVLLFGLVLAADLCLLAVVTPLDWLPAVALAGVGALEYAWQARPAGTTPASTFLGWYVLFHVVFAVFPFGFRRRFAARTGPWAIGALSGVVQFPLVYQLFRRAWPNDVMGLLPAAFALPPLVALLAVRALPTANDRARVNQLAWYGGVALWFITLVFPIQFERQWLTVAWALEGVALLSLFHRIPHPGLRAAGAALLVLAFARLSVNPAVLQYHARGTTAFFNWYLYTYGVTIAALFAGARLAAPPRDRAFGIRIPPLLNTLGTILAFLLLNLEIADFFSAPGTAHLTFEFTGNFARDMSYTIGWALFALGLLLVSIARHLRPGRQAALGLLALTLLKLFFHDLSRLDALYRIAALFAVAAIAIVASFAYQRFLPANDDPSRESR